MLIAAEGRGAVLKTSSEEWEEEGRELSQVCLLISDSSHSGKYTPVKSLEGSSLGNFSDQEKTYILAVITWFLSKYPSEKPILLPKPHL